jgi:hypothetical protein
MSITRSREQIADLPLRYAGHVANGIGCNLGCTHTRVVRFDPAADENE